MSKKTKYAVSETNKILPPKGMHNARIIRFLELGTQETEWGDKFMCQIGFELVDESAVFNEEKGEQNFTKFRDYFRSLSPRSDMGKVVRAALGDIEDEVEMDDILDQPVQIEITHTKDGKYANIKQVIAPPKGKISKSENDVQSLYLDENFDQDVFDSLPDWLQEKIAGSDEFQALVEDGVAEWEGDGPKSKRGSKGDDDDDEPRGRRNKSDEEEDETPKKRGRADRQKRGASRGTNKRARGNKRRQRA